jgi:nucleoside-diphosphate-sugar epimerase
LSTRRTVAWVGADGALGATLAPALGARPFPLRCPDLSNDGRILDLESFDVVIDGAGPRVHPGLAWGDYLREHVGTATQVARSMRLGSHLVFISSAAIYGAARCRQPRRRVRTRFQFHRMPGPSLPRSMPFEP